MHSNNYSNLFLFLTVLIVRKIPSKFLMENQIPPHVLVDCVDLLEVMCSLFLEEKHLFNTELMVSIMTIQLTKGSD